MKRNAIIILVLFLLGLGSNLPTSVALEKPGEELQEVGLSTELGTQIDLGLTFTSENGEQVTLRDLIPLNRPAILIPVYYECPRLCGLVLSGFVEALREVELQVGEDFEIITVSFDPSEGVELARKRAEKYRRLAPDPAAAEEHWHFLVGDRSNVNALMGQIGFKYREDKGEWAHTAALMLLTPQGKISQYFTGIAFSAPDLRLALIEASQGAIGSMLDHALLFCFRFDPTKGRYTWAAFALMRAGGAVTLLSLGGLIFYLWRRDRRKKQVSVVTR